MPAGISSPVKPKLAPIVPSLKWLACRGHSHSWNGIRCDPGITRNAPCSFVVGSKYIITLSRRYSVSSAPGRSACQLCSPFSVTPSLFPSEPDHK